MSQQVLLEPDLASMSDWDNLNNEGKVYRKVLEPGNGEFPQEGQRIEVSYVGNLLNGVQFDTNGEEDNPFIFILGKNEVIKGWDVVISHMMKGEKALVRIHPDFAYGNKGLSPKIPANAWLEFTIKLLDFSEINKEIWEMELYEKVQAGNKLKEVGNGFFKQQNFEEALQQYSEGIKYIEDEQNDPEEKELHSLKLSLYSNASLMSFKLKDWSSSIKYANKVLEIEKENTKALYRRAQASMNYGMFREAKEDCIKIIKIEPNNKEFRTLLEQIKQNEVKANENEKKKFGKLFKDIDMYEEKEGIPPDYIPGPEPAEGNPIVFLEIQVAENQPRRLEIELFKNIVPKTAENFRALCTGEKGIGKQEKPLHYKGCVFHRLVKGFMMQGGDITQGNGIGGESIYGKKFNDENFRIKHYGRGVLSMANKGPNTNSSQIFLNFKNTPHLDGKHVVFGRIIKGLEYLDELENVETNEADNPKVPVTIANCGEVL